MLLTTETVIALRCPMCGKFEQHQLSLFTFSGQKTVQICCSCGATKLTLGTKNRQKFWMQIPCVLCETKHMFFFTRKQIWSNNVLEITCAESKIELGFAGAKHKVAKLVERYEQDITTLLEEMDPDDYINNPTIMMEVLNCLHDIAEEGYLYCGCGNVKIDVDIMPDRLELHCGECGAMGTVFAETEEDVKTIKNMDVIELVKNSFQFLGTKKTGILKSINKAVSKKKKSKEQN